MIDYTRLFHTGVRVHGLGKAMDELGAACDIVWSEVRVQPQPYWTPEEGSAEATLTYTYSCEGPQHIELLDGSPGSIWDGRIQPGLHHHGVWVGDVAAETERCLAAGWALKAAQQDPDDGYGFFSFVEPPSGAALIELVDDELIPHFENVWSTRAS